MFDFSTLITFYLVIQGFLLLFFVRWVLWRNTQLTDLLVWHRLNQDRFKVLDRFRTSPPPVTETPSEPAGERKPYSIDDLDIKPLQWELKE